MFVIIDRESGLSFDGISEYLVDKGISSRTFTDLQEAQDYLSLSRLEHHDFLIHGSVGTTQANFAEGGYTAQMHQLIDTIHEKSPFSRITIFSGVSRFPVSDTVTRLQADGFINEAITTRDYFTLAQRGHVTVDELHQRGKTVENICTGARVEGGMRSYRWTKEQE